jgi:hypothetical protein
MDKLGDEQSAVELMFDRDFQALAVIETETVGNMSGSFAAEQRETWTYLSDVMTARNQPEALINNRSFKLFIVQAVTLGALSDGICAACTRSQ